MLSGGALCRRRTYMVQREIQHLDNISRRYWWRLVRLGGDSSHMQGYGGGCWGALGIGAGN
jgi:hypothetical protein